jgi:hypothetical protein
MRGAMGPRLGVDMRAHGGANSMHAGTPSGLGSARLGLSQKGVPARRLMRSPVQGRQRAHPRLDPSLCPDKLSCPIVAHRLLGLASQPSQVARPRGRDARCSKPCLALFAPRGDKLTSPVAAQTTPARAAPSNDCSALPTYELKRARSRWRGCRGQRETLGSLRRDC